MNVCKQIRYEGTCVWITHQLSQVFFPLSWAAIFTGELRQLPQELHVSVQFASPCFSVVVRFCRVNVYSLGWCVNRTQFISLFFSQWFLAIWYHSFLSLKLKRGTLLFFLFLSPLVELTHCLIELSHNTASPSCVMFVGPCFSLPNNHTYFHKGHLLHFTSIHVSKLAVVFIHSFRVWIN